MVLCVFVTVYGLIEIILDIKLFNLTCAAEIKHRRVFRHTSGHCCSSTPSELLGTKYGGASNLCLLLYGCIDGVHRHSIYRLG